MDSKQLIQKINNPQSIRKDEVIELEQLILDNPYFQSAQLLFAKGLLNIDSIRYNRQLKKAAAYSYERKRLFELITLKSNKKSIIGYGAPAKATTVLNFFKINNSYLKYVIDDNKIKQEKFIPETNIKIKSRDDVNLTKYDYVLVLAWNFFESIVKNNKQEFKKSKFIKLK